MTRHQSNMALLIDFCPDCSCSHISVSEINRIPIDIPLIPERPHNDENRDEEPGIDEPFLPGDPGDEPDEGVK